MLSLLPSIFLVLLAYSLGSIPFGLIITKWAGLGDVRTMGSGNIGATNVLRTGNKKIAALTLMGDLGKGFLAVLLMQKIHLDNNFWQYLAGFAALLGHIFPVWLKFKGGKGVATTLGVYLAWDLFFGVIIILLWLVIAKIFKKSSLAALIAIGISPLIVFFIITPYQPLIYWCLAIVLLVFLKHDSNIRRLINKQEDSIK
jgi:glycerol-3-phosphate acyltransferase PlsY